MYVSKSKVNTDKNNASSIVSVCSTVNADDAVYTAASKSTENSTVTYTFGVANGKPSATAVGSISGTVGTGAYTTLEPAITAYMKTVLPDGLPAAQTGKQFTLTFKVVGSTDKSISVTCTQAE